jgi:Tfp pilus assembly protein PilZ
VGVKRAVLVDRDAALLSRLSGELERTGLLTETLSSTDGLTPDLLALSAPDWLVLDEGLPGLTRAALLVLVRSLKARLPLLQVAVSCERPSAQVEAELAADRAVPRELLLREGGAALQLDAGVPSSVDVRALIDDVLGKAPAEQSRLFEVALDLFGDSNVYLGNGGGVEGIFVATAVLPAIGHKVQLRLNLFGRKSFEAEGEVAWQRPRSSFGGKIATGVGVKLTAVGEEARLALDRFVELREPLMSPR